MERKSHRLFLMIGLAVIHVCCYFLVNYFNSLRLSSAFWNFQTTIDGWIPYLSWTWPFYFGAHLYVTIWAGVVIWPLPKKEFRRALHAYLGMIIIGALIQLTFPARAPWPTDFDSVQRFIHDLFSLRPYACLPSMHVALSILPACISLVTLHSRMLKALSVFIALLITASTLTMKEHYFLDALTGVVLGVLTAILWFLGTGYAIKRSFKKGDQIWKPKIPLRMTE